MPLTIQDVRREVRTALSRISIIDSDTIEVLPGDKPLQPSVKTGAGITIGDGIEANSFLSGVIEVGDFDDLPEITSVVGAPELFFIPVWTIQIGAQLRYITIQTLLTQILVVADEFPSEAPDTINFFDVSASATHSTTIEDFIADNIAKESHVDLLALAVEHAFS